MVQLTKYYNLLIGDQPWVFHFF